MEVAAVPRAAEAVCPNLTNLNLRVSSETHNLITLAWDKPSCATRNVEFRVTDPTLTGRDGCCARLFNTGTNTNGGTSATTWTKTGLSPNTTYYFCVKIDAQPPSGPNEVPYKVMGLPDWLSQQPRPRLRSC